MSRFHDAPEPHAYHRIHLVQGDCQVSDDAHVVFTTTLGSCIAACLYDPKAHVGGMNHFLLPEGGGETSLRYGAFAMEQLVNLLLRAGAVRGRLEAKLFGGGRMTDGLTDIGERNAAFAEAYLAREGIRYESGSMRGDVARRVQFWPATGRARQLELARRPATVSAPSGRAPAPESYGRLELF